MNSDPNGNAAWSLLALPLLGAGPLGWAAFGVIVIASVAVTYVGVSYAVHQYRNHVQYAKTRSKDPPAGRSKSNTRKRAYEKAKKAGKGKEPRHDPNGHPGNPRPHYHPNVPDPKGPKTPHMSTPHDHYYY